jgi:hypothetical protein
MVISREAVKKLLQNRSQQKRYKILKLNQETIFHFITEKVAEAANDLYHLQINMGCHKDAESLNRLRK